MSKHPIAFKQSDLKRALRAARGAGLEVKHVELDPVTGKIIITTTAGAGTHTSTNTLDDWLANHARSS